jgi:hypothetical protein
MHVGGVEHSIEARSGFVIFFFACGVWCPFLAVLWAGLGAAAAWTAIGIQDPVVPKMDCERFAW